MIYNNLEIPTIVLSTKSHEHLGVLHGVDHSTIQLVRNMNAAQEISFDIHKTVDGVEEPLWDSIVSFKYIYLPKGGVITGNPGEYYSIEVSTDDTNETVKHITGTSACEFELSKRKLYDFEINTNADIEYQTQQYKKIYNKEPDKEVVKTWGTKLYNNSDHEHSLLHRVLKDKCPDYTIGEIVPSALAATQRTFSANGQNIYDFLTQTVAKELECVFEFDSATRTISAYSLKMHCDDCGHNGELAAVCPACGSSNYHNYYGEPTNVFISAENYAEQISCSGDTDNVFNCLRISGGDNIITTSFMYVNPTGSQYLYRFSEDMYADMPDALVNKIQNYNTLYESKKPYAERLSLEYYTELDILSQYQHGVPSISPVVTTATEQATALPGRFSDFITNNHYVVIQCKDISVIDTPPNYSSATNAIKGLAEVLVDARYNIEVTTSALSGSGTYERTWTGTVKITNKGDEEDTATTSSFSVKISRTIEQSEIANQDTAAQYLYQRILKRMDRDDRYFKTVYELPTVNDFNAEITRTHTTGEYARKPVYGLEMLKAFQKAYEACVNIMVENGVTDVNSEFYGMALYTTMYLPYAQRLEKLTDEIGKRDTQIATQENVVDNKKAELDAIHKQLDFEKYLGDTLFEVFCHYRMESEYTNSNYISDGLTNAEIIDKARELYDVAAKEVEKASTLQYTLSCSLNNLLQDEQFKDYVGDFQIGNWLTLLSDDTPYALRLTQINVDYGNLAGISVTFSDAIRIGTTVNDVQSVLSKASSMSSSYDTVAHQSRQGEVVHNQVDSWVQDGLNTALVNLKNNTNEEVTFDENGILLRSQDDIFEDYSPYQCRMTHNVLAFTKDGWDTCALAIGQSKYARYVESGNQGTITTDNYGYGVCAEFVSAGYVYGSQIIAGDIYSSNYAKVTTSSGTTELGTHINLDDGTFSIADGQIKFEQQGSSKKLTISIGNKDLSDAVDSVEILYAKNTDPDHAPTSSSAWHDTMPARDEGEYLWQKTITTYINGQSDTSIVNITGIDGKDGEPGEPGQNGVGVDAANCSVSYAIHSSGTSRPTSGWSSSVQTPTDAKPYLWTRTITAYTDGNSTTSYSVSSKGVKGDKGDEGDQGTGISKVRTQYAIGYGTNPTSSSSTQTGWQYYLPDFSSYYSNTNYYYWTRDEITYDDGTATSYTAPSVLYGTTTSTRESHAASEYGEQEVLKVGSGNRMVTVALKSSPSQGSTFTVGANNISLTADEAINFMAGGTINMTGKTINISSTNFSVTSSGEIISKKGTIGGWTIDSNQIYSTLGGGYTITPASANDFAVYDTYSGYTRYKSGSTTYHVANSVARATISFSGYSKFVVVIRSEAESSYDYTVAGTLDATNITRTSTGQGTTKGSQNTNVTVTYSGIDGGSHSIEIIYAKDSSVDTEPDCGYFYVDESQCVSSGGGTSYFKLSTTDFSTSIGGTSRSGLRLAIADKFAVNNKGVLYASGANISGTITATGGTIGGWTIGSNALYNTTTNPDAASLGAIFSTSTGYTYTTSGYYKMRLTSDKLGFYSHTSLSGITNKPTIILQSNDVYGEVSIYNRDDTSVSYETEMTGDVISMNAGSNTVFDLNAITKTLSVANIKFGDSWQYSPAPFMNFSINNGSSQRINLTIGTRATLIFNTAYGSGNGIGNLYRESGGSSKWAAMVTPSSVTVSAATQGTTITNSTGYVLNVGVFIFTGTVTLA